MRAQTLAVQNLETSKLQTLQRGLLHPLIAREEVTVEKENENDTEKHLNIEKDLVVKRALRAAKQGGENDEFENWLSDDFFMSKTERALKERYQNLV